MSTKRRRLVRSAVVGLALFAAAMVSIAIWRGQTVRPAGVGTPVAFAATGQVAALALTMELRSGQGPAQRVHLEGDWQTVEPQSGHGGDSVVKAYRLRDPRVSHSSTTASSAADLASFRATISQPFLVKYVQGRPTQAQFASDVPPSVRNTLLAVVAELPGRDPRMAAPKVTTERDLLGEYLAAFTPEPGGHRYAKKKLRYLNLVVPERDGNTPLKTAASATIRQSAWHFTFDGDGRLTEMDGEDQLTLETGVAGLAPEVSTAIRLRATGTFDASELNDAMAIRRATLVPTPIVTQQTEEGDARRTADKELVGTASLAHLIAGLDAPQRPDGAAEIAQASQRSEAHLAIERVAALLRLQPAAAVHVAEQIRSAPEHPARRRSAGLVQALGLANTAAAQEQLVGLIRDDGVARDVRLSAIRTVAQAAAPTGTTVAALGSLLDDADADLRKAAAYSYGALLAAWRKSDPAATAVAVQGLIQRLDRAKATPERVQALDSLGNAADPVSVSAVRRQLTSDDTAIRTAAIGALRRIMAPGVDDTIRETMRRDPHPAVRAAAIASASFRDATPYADDLAELALHDKEATVRNSAIGLLARTLTTSPRAKQALQSVASSDPKPEIRQRARKMLAAAGGG